MPHIMRNNSNYPKISLSHFSTEIVRGGEFDESGCGELDSCVISPPPCPSIVASEG